MSEHKRYTADEMCDAADWFKREDQHAIAPEIEQMLRYAAEVVERCNEANHDLVRDISAMNGYPLNMDAKDFVEKLDYILRGDAGKEE